MKVFEVDDEKKLASVYDRRIGHEIEGEALGEDFKGFVFRCVRCAATPLRRRYGCMACEAEESDARARAVLLLLVATCYS